MTLRRHRKDMAATDSTRTGVLILRAWLEDQGGEHFRARIVQSLDVAAEGQTVVAVGSVDEARQSVAAWLEAFLAATDGEGPA